MIFLLKKNDTKGLLVVTVLFFLCILASIEIATNKIARPGLDDLFLLPLILAGMLFFFGHIYTYHRGGIGLKIFYIVMLLRYLVQPFLISITNGALQKVKMPNVEAKYYKIAIVIYIIELFVAVITIALYFPKRCNHFVAYEFFNPREHKMSFLGLSLGWCILACMCLVLILRFPVWFPEFNILLFKIGANKIGIVLEASMLNCVKAVLFVYFLTKSTQYPTKSREFYGFFFLALLFGVINFSTYFGTNRSFLFETAFATVALIVSIYPRYKTKILLGLSPILILALGYIYITKQMAVGNLSDFSGSNLNLGYVSYTLEEYVNGLWTVARSVKASEGLTFNTRIQAGIKDIFLGLQYIFEIPGLKIIQNHFNDFLSSSDIFKQSFSIYDRGQMLAFSGNFFIVFGNLFGWILFPIGEAVTLMILINVELRQRFVKSIAEKYMYLWMSFLMALMNCYCVQTLIYCWCKFILFYHLIIIFDRKRIVLGSNRI